MTLTRGQTLKKVAQKKRTIKSQELRAECITDIVVPNSFIALFYPPELFELFYLPCIFCRNSF